MNGRLRDVREVDRFQVQADLAGDDAGDIEQVIDQPRLRDRVPLDDVERMARAEIVVNAYAMAEFEGAKYNPPR